MIQRSPKTVYVDPQQLQRQRENRDEARKPLDPGQYSDFHSIGIANLTRAGFDFFELIERPSEVAPPALPDGRKFQFALIDGWYTFDHTLLDLFYVNRLLEEGGIVAIDDLHLHGVRRAVRYMLIYEVQHGRFPAPPAGARKTAR